MKTGIGFETYLLDNKYEVLTNGQSDSFNSYNHTTRLYTKGNVKIHIGLWQSTNGGTSIGILTPSFNELPINPTPDKYKAVEDRIKEYYK